MNAVKKSVFHKTYGNGIITEHNGDVITVDFSGVEKKFLLPDSFERTFLSTNDEELSVLIEKLISEKLYKKNQKINIKKSNPILFCNISWMDSYLGETDEDIPQNGGSYVAKNKSCNESLNFLPIIATNDNETTEKLILLGSFETKSTNGETSNQTHIERINGCKSLNHSNHADGVTVVWCATAPSGGTYVVGWYKDATVYRYYQQMPIDEDDGYSWDRWYNVSCDLEKAVLLPKKERFNEKWCVPRHNQKNPVTFGFGQANLWYADGKDAKEFAEKMINNIESYCGENIIPAVDKV